jgi:predicted O-linked N-acetylglucosamine transferase (SPINDLY family)
MADSPSAQLSQAFKVALDHHHAGRLADAEAIYRQILKHHPEHADALHLLGLIAHNMARYDDAINLIERAVTLQADRELFHHNLAQAYAARAETIRAAGKLDDAVASYRKAIEHHPQRAEFHNNLGILLVILGRVDEAIAAYRAALALPSPHPQTHSNLLLTLNYRPQTTAAELHAEALHWNQCHTTPPATNLYSNPRQPDRRLRIGYVSPDFRAHSVANFMAGLLHAHDRAAVEVFAFSSVAHPDPVTAQLQRLSDQWRDIATLADEQAHALIRQDRIDILIDLSGHTAGHRLTLFARKPAPIQVTYLGYAGTTGLSAIDYRLTDPHVDPPDAQCPHTETLIRLPETFACFQPINDPVGDSSRFPDAPLTFASFHALAKLSDDLLESWTQILHQTLGSRLLIVDAAFSTPSPVARLSEFFAARGIQPDRLEFMTPIPAAAYLQLHRRVDVLLDCFPWSGHTVACHALWMGVPVVTLAGERPCSRLVTSVLMNLNLPELITQTPEAYIRKAVELASDPSRRSDLRATLRERMLNSPLMDVKRFARNVEAAYRTMWRSQAMSS